MEMSLNLAHASLIFRPVSLHCLPGEKSVFIARSSRRKSTGSLYVFFFFLSLSLSFFLFLFECTRLVQSWISSSILVLMILIYNKLRVRVYIYARIVIRNDRLMSVFEERDFLFDGGEIEKEMEDDRSVQVFICKFNR